MPVQEEMQLLKDVVEAVGNDALPTTLETIARLFSLLNCAFNVPDELLHQLALESASGLFSSNSNVPSANDSSGGM
jgi:hypothetical protein